ncbi:MAG: hypothetical protein AAB868_02850 [Patescibacteria group bacterium]
MDGFWSSLSKWFNEKTSSPLYFTYIGFFIAWNWKFFQIIFLENENLFLTPRIEYIKSKLIFHTPLYSKISERLNIPIDWLLNTAWHILPPAIFTYLAIVYLPKVHKWALDKYLESRFERKKIFEHDKWLLDKEKLHSKTLENIISVKEQQSKIEERIEKTMSDEEKWEIEYQDFEKSLSFFKFRQIIETIYKYDGFVVTTEDFQPNRHADAGALALVDTWGLISYSGSNRNAIEFTKKGKFFAKIYLNKNPVI